MQEEADGEIRALAAQHRRHELEVVVVDPDNRVSGCDVGQCHGKALVDVAIGVPLQAVVGRLPKGIVIQRPEPVVGESFVVELNFVGTDGNRVQVDAVDAEWFSVVVGISGPADPRTTG